MANQHRTKFGETQSFYSVAMITLILLVGWISRTIWLPWLLQFLDVSEAPHKADFIIVPGISTSRTKTAIDLYNQGFAPQIIMCGCSKSLSAQLEVLEEAAIPKDDILLCLEGASTREEAYLVFDRLRENNAQSALIVTDAFHTRRTRATYSQLQPNPSIALTLVKSPDIMTAESWWQNNHTRDFVLKEYPKIAYYLARYGIWPL